MSFNDDEEIVPIKDAEENNDGSFNVDDKVNVNFENKDDAPLEKVKYRVMVVLTGQGDVSTRPGLDLVMVLDVSGSMRGKKITEMKRAMEFMVKKLSPLDRLSVVTFATNGNRLCPLRRMTDDAKKYVLELINQIVAEGDTNIKEGLQKALQVLDERKYKDMRSIGIMLMSDGVQNKGGDAAQVEVSNVPVYTFGYGTKAKASKVMTDGSANAKVMTDGSTNAKAMADVLNAIAKKSDGGTFSNVEKEKDLNMAFAKCLGGLLTVSVQALVLNIAPIKGHSTIENVGAGDYIPSDPLPDGSRNVTFGVLYQREKRRVMVDLVLAKVDKRVTKKVISIRLKASADLKLDKLEDKELGNIFTASVLRNGKIKEVEQKDEVIIEESRLATAKMMNEARVMADDNNFNGAKNKIIEAQSMLDDVEIEGTVQMLEMLKQELDQFMAYLQSPELYKKNGRAFALSSELSHARQRFAARGDMDKLNLFSTPRMDAYQNQAKEFDKDPTKPVPTVEDDQKQDLAADPLSPIIAPLTRLLKQAIDALQAIATILNSASSRKV